MDGAHETGVTTARRAEYDRVEFVGLVSNLGDHCGSFLSGSSIVDSDAGTGTMGGSRGMWAAGVGDAGESGRVRLETLFQKKSRNPRDQREASGDHWHVRRPSGRVSFVSLLKPSA